MQKIVQFILLIALFTSCTKEINNDPLIDPRIVFEKENIAYGKDPEQQLDMYLPAKRNPFNTKIIILIHGGGWMAGDKSNLKDTYDSLKLRLPGYAIFNINYRLTNLNTFSNIWPTQINDVHAAIECIKEKANYYCINPNKIALWGESAGAHLALLEAYKNNNTGSIKAVVDLFAPADMKDFYENQESVYQVAMQILLDGTPFTKASSYINASPIFFANQFSPPTIIFHGTTDTIVPIKESNNLIKKLLSYSPAHKIYRYTGESHGWVGADLVDTYNKSVAFILANLK